jgi:hypothetical protein
MSIMVKNTEKVRYDQTDDTNINRWKAWKGLEPEKCVFTDCNKTENLKGAHVTQMFGDQTKEYIVPLCKEHFDQIDGMLLIDEYDNIMPVNWVPKSN